MKKDFGSIDSDIWLLGDSNPKNWNDDIEYPLDARHPARHNIWTPILNEIQGVVYKTRKMRINDSFFYIRNAIQIPSEKPLNRAKEWDKKITQKMNNLRKDVDANSPKIIFSFGSFAFEFARRSLDQKSLNRYDHWGSEKLGDEFSSSIEQFDIRKTNVIPLLHVSIARGKFIKNHEYFTGKKGGNYFVHVGQKISEMLLKHQKELKIWM
jgi:hypothetical protein